MRRKVKAAAAAPGLNEVHGRPSMPPIALMTPDIAVDRKRVVPIPRNGAAAARSPRSKSVRIFQIFYDDWHKQLLDPEFEPYDNSGVTSELHEFAVFEKIAQSNLARGATVWGALSWRFAEKTGMDGKAWRAAVGERPGHDVYFCNPFPANEALYHNVWAQGEISHPQFLTLARAFFEAAGLATDQIDLIQPSSAFAASNYFVATPAFWEAYLRFVRRALGNAERRLAPRMRALLHSKVADAQGFHFGATYVPFIVERLFPVFLATDGASFKACKVPLPQREAELNVHVRLLREMRDLAHRTKSLWMATCWVNYRNVYLHQLHGRDWCKKYLRGITPMEVRFAPWR